MLVSGGVNSQGLADWKVWSCYIFGCWQMLAEFFPLRNHVTVYSLRGSCEGISSLGDHTTFGHCYPGLIQSNEDVFFHPVPTPNSSKFKFPEHFVPTKRHLENSEDLQFLLDQKSNYQKKPIPSLIPFLP